MRLHMFLILVVIFLILGGACYYMVRRTMALCPAVAARPWLTWGFVVGFIALQIGIPLVHRSLGLRLVPLYWVAYLSFGLISTYFLYLVAADLVHLLLSRFVQLPATSGSWAALSAVSLTVISVGIGFIQCYLPIRVQEVRIPITNLPRDLEGFRIVQISDLHLGPLVSARRVAGLVSRVNGLAPDLVAMTGDLGDGDVTHEKPSLDALGLLKAKHGVRFVTGNHEYYSGVESWLRAVEALGWRALTNEHELLKHGTTDLAIIGLPDPSSRNEPASEEPDLLKAMTGLPPAVHKILLFHQPLGARKNADAGIHLQLSGHVHGGQYFPWSPIIRLFFEYPAGLHAVGSMWLYTSPGTGFWGPPNRFLVPPEITLITLHQNP